MIKTTKYISIKIILLFLFFTVQGFAKNLPPGSGEGDLPANVLILLDKSGSMGIRSGSTGIDSKRPYRLAVGSTAVAGGRNVFLNSRWGSYDKRNISYDDKLTWKWKQSSPCHYNASTEVAEFYDGYFYFVNNYWKEREFCKVNQATGKVTKIKTYNKSSYDFKGGDIYDKYLYLFSYNWSSPKIVIWDLSTEKSLECSYSSGWGTKDLGQTMTSWYFYSNGTPEINRSGTYMMAYGYDWSNNSKRGFYKYNITPGLNCPEKTKDQFIQYNFGSNGQIKYIESASTDDDYFYVANYSKHKIQRFDVSGSTIGSAQIKEIGKNGKHDASYSPTSDSEVKFKNPYSIAVDSTNNRIYVADYGNNAIQVLSEENDGFNWVKKLGGRITMTRMTGAHQAIKAITTDANLTSGVHFGFAYWSSASTVWVYWNYNKYPKCRSIKSKLMARYGVSSSHWWFRNANYTCYDRGGALPGYTGWDSKKNSPWGQGKPCDNDNCLKVKVNKDGAIRTAAEVVKVSAGGGTDAKVFSDIALAYFKHADSPRDPAYKCQVNYIIVIGDGVWSNHASGLKNIKTLKDSYGVKTITIAYGGGISNSGKANFREFAKAGGTGDVIVADDPATLKSTLSAEINRILAERVSFSPPALRASVEQGDSVMQAQFKYVQNQEWRGQLKKTKLNENGSVKKDASGNPIVEWEASAKMPDPKDRKIWSIVPGTDYTTDLNNIVTSNRADIEDMFTLFGSSVNNYHRVTPKVSGTVSNTRCKTATLFGPTSNVSDSTEDDAEGLITFLRGLDYFDYDGDCNLTEMRKEGGTKIYMGDIYNSRMITVGKPNAETRYNSEKEEAYWRALNNYDSWATAPNRANRKEIVYVGANDGMLHAIDFKTGVEKWAFIPPFILPKIVNIINPSLNNANNNPKGGSNAIFGVDGSPVQHDIFFESPFDLSPKWHTVLLVPYGRGGSGFSALIVTDPDAPRHLFSIYNDLTNNKVHVMKHDGSYLGPFEYMKKSYDIAETSEALTVQDLYDDAKENGTLSTLSTDCNDTQNTTCYKSKIYTWENFHGNAMTEKDFTVYINDVKNTNFKVSNTSNTLTITFNTEISYFSDTAMRSGADTVGIYVNQSSNATGVQSPNDDYDYSELGETWSAPRVIRIPDKGPGDIDIKDDLYVAVMGGGYGSKYRGVGSGVYVINLTDNMRPGKIEKFISIEDKLGNQINSSVPGDPVVINRDGAKGYVNYGGAIVYVNDLEGKITKINLTDLVEPNLKLYDHYTLFDVKSTSSDGRFMFHSMDSAIGKDTKQLWLFAGTGDMNNLTDTTPLTSNILLGIADDKFPEFKTPIDVQNFNSGASTVPPTVDNLQNCLNTTNNTVLSNAVDCPKKMPAGIASKRGWVINLDKFKKVTGAPTVGGGIAYYPVFQPPTGGDKCKLGAATMCAVDDECGTNWSSKIGNIKKGDKCAYVGEGILSEIVIFKGKVYANIAGKSAEGSDLIEKDAIGVEVDITRGTWKENF